MTFYRLGYITSYIGGYKELQKCKFERILKGCQSSKCFLKLENVHTKAGIVSNRGLERYGEKCVGLRTLRPSGAGRGLFESVVKGIIK